MQQKTAAPKSVPETGMGKTFLDELNEIVAAGQFVEPDTQVAENEAVIGEMNNYERALIALMERYGNRQKELVKAKFNALMEFTGEVGDLPNVKRRIESLNEHHEAAGSLLWASINDRYYRKEEAAEDSAGFGIRQGFKVVLRFGDECDDDHFLTFLRRLGV